MIGPALILILASASAATPAQAAGASREKAEPAALYRCRHRIANPGGRSGALTLDKTFREDGSVQGFNVQLEDWGGSFIRRSSGSAIVTLRWPGNHLVPKGGAFDWTRGSIDVSFHAEPPSRYRALRKEQWRQVVVDRNRSVIVRDTNGMRILFLSGLDIRLVSGLVPVSSPGRLSMSLDGLLAWGSGVESLTVYETLVTRKSYDRNAYPNSPVGRMRVVSEYEIDVAALGGVVKQVRSQAESWAASLADFRRSCERGAEETGDIIVT